jgi:hypothetical protein
MGPWTTPKGLKLTLTKKWDRGHYLSLWAQGEWEPQILPLRVPSSRQLLESYEECRAWVSQWEEAAQSNPGKLNWKTVNHRQLGQNQIPVALELDSIIELGQFIGRLPQYETYDAILGLLEEEASWLLPLAKAKPMFFLAETEHLGPYLAILNWLREHPNRDIYLRQLSLPGVHTKFIESHQRALKILWRDGQDLDGSTAGPLDLLWGFKTKPLLVRFLILDPALAISGIQDLSIPKADFDRLNPPVDRVLVVENDISALALPELKKTLVIFGRGYSFDSLKDNPWLKEKEIYYWGDIDTHGFGILGQFRSHFPKCKSILMDQETLLANEGFWSKEAGKNAAPSDSLDPQEKGLMMALLENVHGDSVRLEQELIPYDQVLSALRGIWDELG